MKADELCDKYKPICIKHEDNVAHLYLCPEGYPTIGIGCRISNVTVAKALPFYIIKDSKEMLATQEEKEKEFESIKKEKFGKKYPASWYKSKTKLFLKDDAINDLYKARTKEFISRLCQEFANFENYPDEACLALLDMAYNLGVSGLMTKFPSMVKAIQGTDPSDWVEAAKQCHRKPPVNEERNNETRSLFEKAGLKNKPSKSSSNFEARNNFFSNPVNRTNKLPTEDEILNSANALKCEKALSFNPFTGGNN